MIVQSAPLLLNQRNQPSRECLYAWYPEVVTDAPATAVTMAPRDIYIHRGLDKDLLQQDPQARAPTLASNAMESHNDVLQRYKQSMAPSERAYHSAATLDEALRTPWALHYELERRPATPNLPSHSGEVPVREDAPRRLKSAPLIRTAPPTSVLTIPEPQFVTALIPPPASQAPPSAHQRMRASSAKARLGATVTFSGEQANAYHGQQPRQSRSAQRNPPCGELAVIQGVNPNCCTPVCADAIVYQATGPVAPAPPSPPSPIRVYQRSASWCPSGQAAVRTLIQTTPVVLNPHYIRRPGVVSATNPAKRTVIQDNNASRKPSRHRRRHQPHHRHLERRNEPMLAVAPLSYAVKLPPELDGVQLYYDPSLTLNDPSAELKKYFIEGRLYLVKDQRYNVIDNVDPTVVEAYNQSLTLPPRPKYYQTIPVEKLQIPKPPPEVHYNAAETFFYNTAPKRMHRYVIDPNFISEHLNVNKISLSQRPSTAGVAHPTITDLNRQAAAQTTVYA